MWNARARDWAEIHEAACRPLFEAVVRRTEAGPGACVLDIGCGAGGLCLLASRAGARVWGIDAAENLLEFARQRVPGGDFRVGEMEDLPYPDASFDVVAGVNAFQYAQHPNHALREARRVARPGGKVVIATWGKPEDCQASEYLDVLRSFLPPAPPGAAGPFALSADGALEALATQAGLTPGVVEEVDGPFAYPDLETALRGLLSAGPAVKAIQVSGEAPVRAAVMAVLAKFRTPDGGYIMNNRFRYLPANV